VQESRISRSTETILLTIFLVGATPLHAADGTQMYRDREYGFSFEYPSTWSAQPGIGKNTRVVLTAPSTLPEANCNVVVRHVPSIANKTQIELNRGLDGKEFERDYWLRDMPKNTRVFDSKKHSLGKQVARSAVLHMSVSVQGITQYGTQLHLITLRPGLFFGFTCGAGGDTAAEATAGFTYWKTTFSTIVFSLRFTDQKR
jgi:hypothetical protein